VRGPGHPLALHSLAPSASAVGAHIVPTPHLTVCAGVSFGSASASVPRPHIVPMLVREAVSPRRAAGARGPNGVLGLRLTMAAGGSAQDVLDAES
jgi:hypothetical protein